MIIYLFLTIGTKYRTISSFMHDAYLPNKSGKTLEHWIEDDIFKLVQ